MPEDELLHYDLIALCDVGQFGPGDMRRLDAHVRRGGGLMIGLGDKALDNLDALSAYLKSNFGYDTGPYQDYPFETPAKRYLAKLDYNLNDRNKISVRYLQLDSESPTLVSNSSSLGRGTRRSRWRHRRRDSRQRWQRCRNWSSSWCGRWHCARCGSAEPLISMVL